MKMEVSHDYILYHVNQVQFFLGKEQLKIEVVFTVFHN